MLRDLQESQNIYMEIKWRGKDLSQFVSEWSLTLIVFWMQDTLQCFVPGPIFKILYSFSLHPLCDTWGEGR